MLVLSTAPDASVARVIARVLIERRLAACVNLLPAVASIYRWKGAIEESGEVLMVIKTTSARLAELEPALLELHPYEVPEFVALAAEHVAAPYLEWLRAESGPGA